MSVAVLEKQVIVDVKLPHRELAVKGRVRNGKLTLNGHRFVEVLTGPACVVIVTMGPDGEVEHCPHPRLPLHKCVKKHKMDGFWGINDRIVKQGPYNYNVSKKQGGGDALTVLAVAMWQGFCLPALESGGFDVTLYVNSAGEVQATLALTPGSVWVGKSKKQIEDMAKPIFEVVELPAPTPEKAVAAGNAQSTIPLWNAPQLRLFDLPEPPKNLVQGNLKERIKSLNSGKKAI